jgi:Zn-dependent alcohol dehydrogenase
MTMIVIGSGSIGHEAIQETASAIADTETGHDRATGRETRTGTTGAGIDHAVTTTIDKVIAKSVQKFEALKMDGRDHVQENAGDDETLEAGRPTKAPVEGEAEDSYSYRLGSGCINHRCLHTICSWVARGL